MLKLRHHCCRHLAAWVAVVLGCGSPAALTAEAGRYSEPAVKAVFLYRFTGFVDWPAAAMRGSEFEIGVLGADAVAEALARVLLEHRVKGLPARVRRIRDAREIGHAQLLYVGPDASAQVPAIVQATRDAPVLVVSDTSDGLEQGSAINFLLLDQRVRFEVSLPAANRAGLHISSELLAVALRVAGPVDREPDRRSVAGAGESVPE